MIFSYFSESKQRQAATSVIEYFADLLNANYSVQLWDGTRVPLGKNVDSPFYIAIRGPGVVGSLVRRPTLENFILTYATGGITVHGGSLLDFINVVRENYPKKLSRKLKKFYLFRKALPFLFARSQPQTVEHQYDSDETGLEQKQRDEKKFIQFHYDLGNDFYKLFLDPEMQYSCAYFRDWENSLETVQRDKLEIICRKLRLQEGDRFLDIGSGWGGLCCYAAKHYGVQAHGVTLSQEQYDYACQKVKDLGLEEKVKIELRDYSTLDGTYDKIASIGMYEHVGIANYPKYFKKMYHLLRDRGIFLNHGITRRAKRRKKKFNYIRPGKRFILKYIFPGSELDHIGHTLEVMEASHFEIHDVENWREHYGHTLKYWAQNLSANREEAVGQVGIERYRLWEAYLVGVHMGFMDGNLRIYQTIASKHQKKGSAQLPPTREAFYESWPKGE